MEVIILVVLHICMYSYCHKLCYNIQQSCPAHVSALNFDLSSLRSPNFFRYISLTVQLFKFKPPSKYSKYSTKYSLQVHTNITSLPPPQHTVYPQVSIIIIIIIYLHKLGPGSRCQHCHVPEGSLFKSRASLSQVILYQKPNVT